MAAVRRGLAEEAERQKRGKRVHYEPEVFMKSCMIGLAILALSEGILAQQPAPRQSDKSVPIIRSVGVALPAPPHPYFAGVVAFPTPPPYFAGVSFRQIRQAWREHDIAFGGAKLSADDIGQAKGIIVDLYKTRDACVTVDHEVTLMSEGSVRLAFSIRSCGNSDPAAAITNH